MLLAGCIFWISNISRERGREYSCAYCTGITVYHSNSFSSDSILIYLHVLSYGPSLSNYLKISFIFRIEYWIVSIEYWFRIELILPLSNSVFLFFLFLVCTKNTKASVTWENGGTQFLVSRQVFGTNNYLACKFHHHLLWIATKDNRVRVVNERLFYSLQLLSCLRFN